MGRSPVTPLPPSTRGPGIQRRIRILALIGTGIFLLLLFQLWHLQVIQGKHYRQLSENNRLRVVPIPPHRGLVYDRHGEILVRNVPSFSLGIVKEDVDDLPGTLIKLSPLVGMSPEEMTQRIRSTHRASPFTPAILKERLTEEEMARVKGHQWELPGVVIEVETLREYPHGPLAAHLLGYVGEISQSQLESPEFAEEIPGRIIGQYGVEKSYDEILRGVPGRKEIEVDAMGRERRTLRTENPVPGDGVVLSLDLKVQKAAEEALGDRAGVVVAMDPHSGEVLSLVSHPAFDPNILSGRLTRGVWQGILNDPGRPLNNRAVQGQFPPGSVFKIVMALGGMERGFVDPPRRVTCSGTYPMGRRVFHDWKKEGHGSVDLHRAIVESCDVYFYQLGNRMGVDTIAEFATGMGLGEPTGIDLPSEKRGLIPSTDWKRKVKGDKWYPGETLPVSIGQGYVLVTPVQQASMLSTVATSGVRVRPRVVRGVVENGRYFGFPSVETGRVKLSPEAVETVKSALRGVVSEPHGTGYAARSPLAEIGGKTGTAQVVGGRLGARESETPYQFRDHAWFVAFAPVDDPRIVVAVLVEHGGHGGSAAAPVAKQVIEAWLGGGTSS